MSPSEDVNMRAWWKTLDDTSLYPELPSSLESLAGLLRAHPVDGIIGFSQGACTAMMLTALCEGTPERLAALRRQGAPVDLIHPPQVPFKFTIACCGFSGNPTYYSGFYEPKISTPSLHLIADWDTMVVPEQSARLVQACLDPTVVRHRGGHHVPTDLRHLKIISDFISDACAAADRAPLPPVRYFNVSLAKENNDAGVEGMFKCAGSVSYGGAAELASGLITPPLSTSSEGSKVSSRNRWQWKRTKTITQVQRRVC